MTRQIIRSFVIAALLICMMTGCGTQSISGQKQEKHRTGEKTEVIVFAAKSLDSAMDELIKLYEEANPDVMIHANYDSSGTLVTQIAQGGAACDIFFPASEKQMDMLEEKGMLRKDTRGDILKNQLCVVTYAGSTARVSGLSDIGQAKSLAIAGGSVPLGFYTRTALMETGILNSDKSASEITAMELSDALGTEINECINAGAVVCAIAEHSNEAGTIYYSDMAGFEDTLEILEMVPEELTGEILYPAAGIINYEADEAEQTEAIKFLDFLKSDKAKDIYKKYYFGTDL